MSRIISMTDASSDQEHIPMIVDNDTRRRADVNNDGEVSLSDINMIIDVILG